MRFSILFISFASLLLTYTSIFANAANTTIFCQCRCIADRRVNIFAVTMCTECTKDACNKKIPDCLTSTHVKSIRDANYDTHKRDEGDTNNYNANSLLTQREVNHDDLPSLDSFQIKCFQPGSYKDEAVVDSFVAIVFGLFLYYIWDAYLSKRFRRPQTINLNSNVE